MSIRDTIPFGIIILLALGLLIGIVATPTRSKENPTRCLQYDKRVMVAIRGIGMNRKAEETTETICSTWELCSVPCTQGTTCGDWTCTKTQGWMK